MELVHELTMHIDRSGVMLMHGGPYGQRVVGIVGGGRVTGERISGELVGPGGDWAIRGTDGFVAIDVRLQIRTDDGVDIFMQYTGTSEGNAAMAEAMKNNGETSFADSYFRTHVRMESGDSRYSWVNRTLFVGQGRAVPDGVEYEIHRIA